MVRTENGILYDLIIYKVVSEMEDGTQYDVSVHSPSCRL